MRARIELQPRDLWIGAYWTRRWEDGRTHVWLCLIPCIALHLVFGRDRRLLGGTPPRGRWRRVRS